MNIFTKFYLLRYSKAEPLLHILKHVLQQVTNSLKRDIIQNCVYALNKNTHAKFKALKHL